MLETKHSLRSSGRFGFLVVFSVLGSVANAASISNFIRVLFREPPNSVFDPILEAWAALVDSIFSAVPLWFGWQTPIWLDLLWATSFIGATMWVRFIYVNREVFYFEDDVLPTDIDPSDSPTFMTLVALLLGLSLCGLWAYVWITQMMLEISKSIWRDRNLEHILEVDEIVDNEAYREGRAKGFSEALETYYPETLKPDDWDRENNPRRYGRAIGTRVGRRHMHVAIFQLYSLSVVTLLGGIIAYLVTTAF